ncbi:MAG: TIGR01777 family protein [Chloroflexi bacterium]|nr:TIGR01777 family protein [Chloroflexota bacterium]
MRVLISGASGFIGKSLTARLLERGDEVVHLVRREPESDSEAIQIRWDTTDPDSVNVDDLGAVDAVFNFSGATVAKRWTRNYLDVISSSRIITTKTLVEIIRRMEAPPNVLITASGVAFYGDRDDEQLTEQSERGEGILADIAVPWEAATASAEEFGVRTATARFGMVFAADDGPLPVLARPFRTGLGGRLGNGRQWTPWIHIDDAISALIFVAENESLNGPINVVSPGVVRNSEISQAIADALHKPCFGWMPAIIAKFVIGNYIQELAIDSKFVIPEKLLQASFEFKYRDLRACLEHELSTN